MSNGVRSNRYVGVGPSPGKAAPAFAEPSGSTRRSIKSGKGSSTKKRRVGRKGR